jgi:hypothetical protein
MSLTQARRFINEWRRDHRHYDGPAADPTAKPIGFNLQQTQAIASMEFDGYAEGDGESESDDGQ